VKSENFNHINHKLSPKRVNFGVNPTDYETAFLATVAGQTTKSISRATGLSKAQVEYRLKVAGAVGKSSISRAAWRNGTSPLVKMAINALRPVLGQELYQRYLFRVDKSREGHKKHGTIVSTKA
jgi:hypothetical protein